MMNRLGLTLIYVGIQVGLFATMVMADDVDSLAVCVEENTKTLFSADYRLTEVVELVPEYVCRNEIEAVMKNDPTAKDCARCTSYNELWSTTRALAARVYIKQLEKVSD